MALQLLVLISLCGVTSFVATKFVRTFAVRHGVIDAPNARSSHSQPTPRGGGIAILVSITLGLSVGAILKILGGREWLGLVGGMWLVGTVGWADDRGGVRPLVRLFVHTAAACLALGLFHGLSVIRLGGTTLQLGWLGFIAGVVGIVWSINLFNFMDGIDGLAGSQSVVTFGAAALLLTARGAASLSYASACIAAASAGFLFWNWPPARIFLGDVGSGALGYLLAALAIAAEANRTVPLLLFIIINGVFVSDATVTLLRRLMRGHHPAVAHHDHAYQRLARAWSSHRRVTVSAITLTVLLAALSAVGDCVLGVGRAALIAALSLGLALYYVERRAPLS